MDILFIIFGVTGIILFLVALILFGRKTYINQDVAKANQELENENQKLLCQKSLLEEDIDFAQKSINARIAAMREEAEQNYKNQCRILDESYADKVKQFEISVDNLEKRYLDKEEYYKAEVENLNRQYLMAKDEAISSYKKSINEAIQKMESGAKNYFKTLEAEYIGAENYYDKKSADIIDAYNYALADLIKIQNTRKAAIEAQNREKEIKEKLSFYCIKLTPSELQDAERLNSIKPSLNQPRVLSMLIWQTYYQKPMTNLCNNVLGAKTVCGIYKITNQLTDMCYIGQSVDVAKRWKDHAKCGLGIDTPAGNKLYKAMLEHGLYNFSFELLEECKREELDEKEKSYIKIYQSQSYGYNTVSGNGAIDLLGE